MMLFAATLAVATAFSNVVSHVGPTAVPTAAPKFQEYSIDAGHSIVEFTIKFAFSRIKGRFTQSKGTILYDAANPANSSITIIMESKSLDTGWPHRDEHLRTSDFFDVEKYPTIAFHSERLRQVDSGWVAEGPLTMHGVTKQIAIPFRFPQPPTRSPESRWMIINAVGGLRLARADFGIMGGSTYNSWFDKARAATMGDSVDISLEIEGWSADAVSQRSPQIEAALERFKTGGIQAHLDRLAELKRTKTPEEFQNWFVGQDLVTRALIANGRVPEALALAKVLPDLYPASASARLIYGFTLAVSGDNAGAAREYVKGKEVFKPTVRDPNEKFPQDDDKWWYLDQLVRTALDWGRVAEAVPLAKTVAELYPGIARAATTYGQALAASGDEKGAAAQFARALSIDSRETRALEHQRRLAR